MLFLVQKMGKLQRPVSLFRRFGAISFGVLARFHSTLWHESHTPTLTRTTLAHHLPKPSWSSIAPEVRQTNAFCCFRCCETWSFGDFVDTLESAAKHIASHFFYQYLQKLYLIGVSIRSSLYDDGHKSGNGRPWIRTTEQNTGQLSEIHPHAQWPDPEKRWHHPQKPSAVHARWHNILIGEGFRWRW